MYSQWITADPFGAAHYLGELIRRSQRVARADPSHINQVVADHLDGAREAAKSVRGWLELADRTRDGQLQLPTQPEVDRNNKLEQAWETEWRPPEEDPLEDFLATLPLAAGAVFVQRCAHGSAHFLAGDAGAKAVQEGLKKPPLHASVSMLGDELVTAAVAAINVRGGEQLPRAVQNLCKLGQLDGGVEPGALAQRVAKSVRLS